MVISLDMSVALKDPMDDVSCSQYDLSPLDVLHTYLDAYMVKIARNKGADLQVQANQGVVVFAKIGNSPVQKGNSKSA